MPIDKSASSNEDFIGKSLIYLEKNFADLSMDRSPFGSWVRDLLKTPFWTDKISHIKDIKKICIALADAQDLAFSKTPEPKYHNRSHFKDVCLSITELLKTQKQIALSLDSSSLWVISDHDALILLLCAICHDFGHDGSINTHPFEIEKKSIALVENFLAETSLELFARKEIIKSIEPIILSTDPKYLPILLNKFDSKKNLERADYLSALMVEADLLASTLPQKGKSLGEQLSEEWQLNNPESAAVVKTNKGRLYFLEHIRFISPQSGALGMENIRNISIHQVKE